MYFKKSILKNAFDVVNCSYILSKIYFIKRKLILFPEWVGC